MTVEYALVRGRALRVSKLDACGSPDPGPFNKITTKGFISLGLEPVNTEGESIAVTNANGERCVTDDAVPAFDHWALTLTLCGVNPYLINLLTGQPIVYDEAATPAAVGYQIQSGVDLSTVAAAFEVWSKIPANLCAGGLTEYGYSLVPFASGGTIGGISFENGAVNMSVTGMVSKDGTGWGVGPYNVRKNATTGVDGPLKTALSTKTHFHQERVTVAPPSPVDGGSALGQKATTATAGTPGTYSPANSYGGVNLADMTGITASPTTAWTTGQYVLMEDGNKAKWNATTWIAG
jgi:hypothetical protein